MSRVGFVSVLGVLALVACSSGSSGSAGTGTSGYVITISNYKFSPDPLVVPAGSTVTVVNDDTKSTSTHTATSEAAAGDYDAGKASDGFAFDTGDIDAGTSGTITVPAGVASGVQQHYFCRQHGSMMQNPDPVIQVQ